MSDFSDVLFKRTYEPAELPAPENVATAGDAERYALQALASEMEAVSTAAPGTRNHTLNVAAYNLGQLVGAGHLNAATVIQNLTVAALAVGLDRAEILPTISSGLGEGQKKPRVVAEAVSAPLPPTSVLPELTEAAPPMTAEQLAELQAQVYEQRVSAEMNSQRLRREARKRLDAEDAVAQFREPAWWPSLTVELREPEVETQYSIERMLPAGGNVLLTAAFKAGKTTLVNNLAKSYADDVPFLGRYKVNVEPGRRIALFNYEVDTQQYRRWLRHAGIVHGDSVVLLHLRGSRLPLTVPFIEDWVVDWLQARNVGMWIVDPFARAYTGCGDENDNSAVGTFLDTLDVIKARAGVRDLILTAHTGRAEHEQGRERARGATRLDDWADVRWLLNRADDDQRVLSATGRDVEVDEGALTFDPTTRLMTFTEGLGRRLLQTQADAELVRQAVTDDPGILRTALRDGLGIKTARADAAIRYAVDHHFITVSKGAGRSEQHWPNTVAPLSDPVTQSDPK